ncbi:SDR family oxidoreductase [Tessaracoccus sp. MC1865]|nr:SDR family oxidoreductase [Tessaracoccus sp. MC1865]
MVVTGAARGVGKAIADRLEHRGAHVLRGDMSAVTDDSGGTVVEVDVTDPASVRQLFQSASDQFGRVDAVINCAGILGPVAPSEDYPLEHFDRVVGVNLRGAFIVSQVAIPLLLAGHAPRLVHIASIAGKEGNPQMAAYSASKAGVIGLVKALAKEYAATGLLVNALAPASIETPMIAEMSEARRNVQRSLVPMGRFGTTDDAANVLEFMASEECSFTTGFVFDLSGGRADY